MKNLFKNKSRIEMKEYEQETIYKMETSNIR